MKTRVGEQQQQQLLCAGGQTITNWDSHIPDLRDRETPYPLAIGQREEDGREFG